MVLKILKKGVQLALIPLAVSVIVLVLLALVYLLPTAGMKAHVANTLGNFEKEGMYFYSLTGEAGADQDNFIEALYLDQAIVGTEDADLVSCVLSGYDYVHVDDEVHEVTPAEIGSIVIPEGAGIPAPEIDPSAAFSIRALL